MTTREQFTPEVFEYIEQQIAEGNAVLVTNKSYEAHIQKGSDLIAKGVTEVFNKLEDTSEQLVTDCFVITGAAGEQWCIREKHLKKYGVLADEIPVDGLTVMTIPDGIKFLAVHMPLSMTGCVKTSWVELKFNVEQGKFGKIPHGDGDWIIIRVDDNGNLDYENGDARAINGTVFNIIYRVINDSDKGELV